MRFDALFARRDEVFASQLIKKRRYRDQGKGGRSPDGEAVIQRVLSLYTEGATRPVQ